MVLGETSWSQELKTHSLSPSMRSRRAEGCVSSIGDEKESGDRACQANWGRWGTGLQSRMVRRLSSVRRVDPNALTLSRYSVRVHAWDVRQDAVLQSGDLVISRKGTTFEQYSSSAK